jgi:AcrR family transcriptional regulator
MSSATKTNIIRAAEVLFARDGYQGTSLRAITEQAGANVAAVNYHFGSKENLLIEILDRIVGPLNRQRLELLDEVEAKGVEAKGPERIRDILTAFLLPDLHSIEDLRARDPALTRFVARMYTEGTELMGRIMGRQFAETHKRFYQAFEAALPHLDQEDIEWRLHCIVGIVVYLFATADGAGTPNLLGNHVDENLDRLLEVALPIMTAPRREVTTSTS